jgi:hypothetical protein
MAVFASILHSVLLNIPTRSPNRLRFSITLVVRGKKMCSPLIPDVQREGGHADRKQN